ncbi:hypothetical protein TNCT_681251 [Trichonephila clavata]|uniref:Uncharacterized protein n=1 Tax=Trichonephila clavata TaxID=2740835 RepID=A0A8X6FDW2_TRICU|nr:hypothetical protein TNCT_681251 [Trichonephila clavata]
MSVVYIDDLLIGADNLESGRKLQEQLVSLLTGAGMELHKWSSSNPLLLSDSMLFQSVIHCSISDSRPFSFFFKRDQDSRARPKPHPDSFAFKISPMTSNSDSLIVTKKSVISTIVRLFYPL